MVYPRHKVKNQENWIVVADQLRHNTSCYDLQNELLADIRKKMKNKELLPSIPALPADEQT